MVPVPPVPVRVLDARARLQLVVATVKLQRVPTSSTRVMVAAARVSTSKVAPVAAARVALRAVLVADRRDLPEAFRKDRPILGPVSLAVAAEMVVPLRAAVRAQPDAEAARRRASFASAMSKCSS